MAEVNFFDHFELPWARNGAVEGITDSQWQAGWNFIGATPPSVEQFNMLQQISDQRSAWLFRQFKRVANDLGYPVGADEDLALLNALRYSPEYFGVAHYRVASSIQVDDVGKLIAASFSVDGILTLPRHQDVIYGAVVRVVNTGAGRVSIVSAAGDSLSGGASLISSVALGPGDDLEIIRAESDWILVGGSARLKYTSAFDSSSARNGYQMMPGGLMYQWGVGSAGANGEAFENAMPMSFSSESFVKIAVHAGTFKEVNVVVDNVAPNQLSTIVLRSNHVDVVTASWFAIGR